MSFEEMTPSTVLHWNYRGFTEFPLNQLTGEESEVTDIYLKENLLTRLPNNIGVLERLESLYVSGNDITELPKEICKLRCLKCLDVSGNRLKCIPDEIGEAKNLKFLILDENELTELPLRIVELRLLRYLSVCDNKLQWLPQRPVFNYHHCEFRFWRNPSLKTLPYSLWYHMFRDQQTRCLNIGCLINDPEGIPYYEDTRITGPQCQLKVIQDSKEIEIFISATHYNIIRDPNSYSPPSLYEISKRFIYEMINETVRKINPQTYSIYAEYYRDNLHREVNNNVNDLQRSFKGITVDENTGDICDVNRNNYIAKLKEARRKKNAKTYYIPADVIKENLSFLPTFVKRELSNGPISRCENLLCKKAIFDCVYHEFCFGEIMLIDKTEDVLLSATFCSKYCADYWKRSKDTIPWTLT